MEVFTVFSGIMSVGLFVIGVFVGPFAYKETLKMYADTETEPTEQDRRTLRGVCTGVTVSFVVMSFVAAVFYLLTA